MTCNSIGTTNAIRNIGNPSIFYSWLSACKSNAVMDEIDKMKTALNAKLQEAGSANTDLIKSIASLQTDLKNTTNDIKITQDRALLVRHPELSSSYYDGFLSIGRPIKQSTVPILIAIATFLFCLSFFVLLKILRVDARLIVSIPAMFLKGAGLPTPLAFMTFTSIVLLGLTIYAFTK
jgi:hypothetical protein